MGKLYILTNHFPYSTQENFLEDELVVLKKYFEEINIIPLRSDRIKRAVKDCNVLEAVDLPSNRLLYNIKGLFAVKTIKYVLCELLSGKAFRSRKRFRNWISATLEFNNFANCRKIQKIFRNIDENDIVYSYWGTSQIKTCLFLNSKVRFISRFHGAWDLWEDTYDDYFPYREQIVKRLTKAYFISPKGQKYFAAKYSDCQTECMPLGSLDYGNSPAKKNDGVFRVVSCSTIYPLKRVPLLFEALNSLTTLKIEWTHIGGGTDFDALKNLVLQKKKEHLEVILTGMKTHDEVIEYYKNNHYDVFVNLSTSEGVPVSIMEAISFDIPIIATNVGCTSDVVPSSAGILISSNPDVKEIHEAILKLNNMQFEPRNFWIRNYNAVTNYSNFAKSLTEL